MKNSLFIVLFLSMFMFAACDGYQAKKTIADPDQDPFASADEDLDGTDMEIDESDTVDDFDDVPDDDFPFPWDDDDIIVVPDDDEWTDDPVTLPDESNLDDDIYNDEDPDEEPGPCVDECSILDTIQCIGDKVVKCTLQDDCMQWIEVNDCSDTERFCRDNNTIGSSSSNNVRNNVYKGTFIEATSNSTVYEFSMDLDNDTGQPLIFAVYVSDTRNGEYELFAVNIVENPGTGRRMYSSGHIKPGEESDLHIEEGKFYIFGVAWEEDLRSYYRSYTQFIDPFVSETISFGKTIGGFAPQDSYPLPVSFVSPSIGIVTYRTKFNTGVTDPEICVCNNRCPSVDNTRCNANWVEKCLEDDFECRNWQQQEDCDFITCVVEENLAQCKNLCVDECTLGEKRCVKNVLEECKKHLDDCAYWVFEENCSENATSPYCETLELSPADAKCGSNPNIEIDHIAENSNQTSSNNTGHAKGVYVRADHDARVTEFKFNISAPEKTDVYFSIYESSSRSGEYSRIYRGIFEVDVEDSEDLIPVYYGPEDISVDIKKDHFYLFQFWDPDGVKFHARCGNQFNVLRYPTVFGEAVGHSNFEFENEPPETRELNDTGNCFYRMWIESHLR
jgi:hypothetical protein